MAGGRPSKYEKLVKPRLFEISEWRRIGWTEEEIAKELGLSRRTLTQYKHLYPEFLRALKNETEELVKELRGALVRRAKGYQYVETKKIYERNEDGQLVHIRTEETTKSQPADVAALNLALKNFDRENWSNDPQLLALKREELELKKKQIEKDDW
jgi:transcriptional regulator with XRE-family HTH domain